MDHPQPALWLPSQGPAGNFLSAIPELTSVPTLTLLGLHVVEDAIVLVDGHAVEGDVSCEIAGELPECEELQLRVDLAALPAIGEHTLQLGTPGAC